jgi:hypothetical protein
MFVLFHLDLVLSLLYTIVKVAKKNKPRRGVSPKPMQKLLSAPDEAGLPVDSGLNGRSTEVKNNLKKTNKKKLYYYQNARVFD